MSIISYNWEQTSGVAGFPAWRYSGTCTNDQATLRTLEVGGVPAARVKFVAIPNRRELVAMALDGTELVLHNITPNNYDLQILECVKLIPVEGAILAHPQPAGHEYAGQEIVTFAIMYQQTKWNHV